LYLKTNLKKKILNKMRKWICIIVSLIPTGIFYYFVLNKTNWFNILPYTLHNTLFRSNPESENIFIFIFNIFFGVMIFFLFIKIFNWIFK